jgi:hypothetical protein
MKRPFAFKQTGNAFRTNVLLKPAFFERRALADF